MQALTRFVLRHKALVALAWLLIAVAGAATIGGTTHRMTNNFAMPGQAYAVDNQIVAEYGNGGSQTPYVPVLTAAPGQQMTEPAVAAEAGRVFSAMAASVPDARLVDHGATGSGRLSSRLWTGRDWTSGPRKCTGCSCRLPTSRRMPPAA